MIVVEKDFDIQLNYDLNQIGDPEKILFFDIETTGLSAYNSSLYLIGTVFLRNGVFHMKQWFAESLRDEIMILKEFFAFTEDFDTLLHFNGDTFDIRYLTDCAAQYSLPVPFERMASCDILKRVRKHRALFQLENYKQKTIERFLGIGREDRFTGGELIGIYEAYTENQDERLKKFLLLHNEEDCKGMPEILPVLSYTDTPELTEEEITVMEAFLNKAGSLLTVYAKVPMHFPVKLDYTYNDAVRITFREDELIFEIAACTGSLKYFFPNPKDYYYLPKEDCAIHKKLASFVDKAYRVPAKPETCYTRTDGVFLTAVEKNGTPLFYKEYKDKQCYVKYEETSLKSYLLAVLKGI